MKNNGEVDFDPIPHTYSKDGVILQGATSFVDSFFGEFKSKEISKNVSSGFKSRNEKKRKSGIKVSKEDTEKENPKFWLKDWDKARDYGNSVHDEIDEYLKSRGETNVVHEDSRNAIKWLLSKIPDKCILYSEKRLHSKELCIAGTADIILEKDGHVLLVDWKTSKKLDHRKNGMCKEPIEYLKDTKLNKYYLQLNLYKYILEKEYEVVVDSMLICHSRNGKLKEFVVPDMRKEIELMIAHKQ